MITAHFPASYLLTQLPIVFGHHLSIPEQIAVIISGTAIDLDLFIAKKFVKNSAYHHLLPSHTPLFNIILWLFFILIFNHLLSFLTLCLILVAMLFHLVLDDLGYWLSLFKLQKNIIPQIFWLYPFDKRRSYFLNKWQYKTNYILREIPKFYIKTAPINVFLEILLWVVAIGVFIIPGK